MTHDEITETRPSWKGTARTPFHKLHLTKNYEAVNEYGTPVCSFEIDDLPKKTIQENSEFGIIAMNCHDDLVRVLKSTLTWLENLQELGANLSLGENGDEESHIAKIESALKKAGSL